MNNISTDILITYSNGDTSTHTKIDKSFNSIIEGFAEARDGKCFGCFNGFAINPHYIVTIKQINPKDDEGNLIDTRDQN